MSEDESKRKPLRPNLQMRDVLSIFEQIFTNESDVFLRQIKLLDSYDDQNFYINFKKGGAQKEVILKIHNGHDSQNNLFLEAQTQLLCAIGEKNVPAPRPIPLQNEEEFIRYLELPTKTNVCTLAVRALTFIPGEVLSDISINKDELFKAGKLLGKFTVAVENLEIPGLNRKHCWDLQNAGELLSFVDCIKDVERRQLVQHIFARFEEQVIQTCSTLRKSIIMGDFNDANIVRCTQHTEGDGCVLGMIDFGDAVYSWLVNDIAIGMAYALISSFGKRLMAEYQDSLPAAMTMLKGYCELVQLTPEEKGLLRILMCTRLAMSATVGAYSFQQDPANEYLLLHAEPAWKALGQLWRLSDEKFLAQVDATLNPTTKPKITFVTGNLKKLAEVQAILGAQFEVINKAIDLPEFQGPPMEVAIKKCKLAAEIVSEPGPILIEDVSLVFNALGTLPGPYIKWFLDGIGCEGLYNLLDAHEDKTGYAQCIFAYTEGPGLEVQTFDGQIRGCIVPPRGPKNFGWDPIFQPQGYTETFAELTADKKNTVSHRRRALDLFLKHLQDTSKAEDRQVTKRQKLVQPFKALTFVTGNAENSKEISEMFGTDFPFKVVIRHVPFLDIQGHMTSEILQDKCKRAGQEVNGPVLCEVLSVCFNALKKGLPGPYTKWFLKDLGVSGLFDLIKNNEDKSGYVEYSLAFSPGPNSFITTYKMFTETIVGEFIECAPDSIRPKEISLDWGRIFCPEGYSNTYAELDSSVKQQISPRKKAIERFTEYAVQNLINLCPRQSESICITCLDLEEACTTI